MTTEGALYYDATYASHEVDFLRHVRSQELKLRHKMSTPATLTPNQAALADRIRKAFAGVTVGPDTTLYLSGEAMDGYVGDAFLAEMRRREIRDDWQRIPLSLLVACETALSFVDAEGMRYLLPAWMLAELQHPQCSSMGLEIHLSDIDDMDGYLSNQLSLLNDEQRACVTDCIRELRLRDCDEDLEPFCPHLLPWENKDHAAHYPHLSKEEYVAQDLRRYCKAHGAAPPAPPEAPDSPQINFPAEDQAELARLFRENMESQRRMYTMLASTLKTPLTRARKKLIERIRKAFFGVRAGENTYLYLSKMAQNEPLSEEFIASLRAEEIRDDWQRIPKDMLYIGDAYLAIYDPEALHYLMPAYMIMALEHTCSMLSYIPGRDFFDPERLMDFNAEQLACVDEFFRIRPSL